MIARPGPVWASPGLDDTVEHHGPGVRGALAADGRVRLRPGRADLLSAPHTATAVVVKVGLLAGRELGNTGFAQGLEGAQNVLIHKR